jgi:hypothetical protein
MLLDMWVLRLGVERLHEIRKSKDSLPELYKKESNPKSYFKCNARVTINDCMRF